MLRKLRFLAVFPRRRVGRGEALCPPESSVSRPVGPLPLPKPRRRDQPLVEFTRSSKLTENDVAGIGFPGSPLGVRRPRGLSSLSCLPGPCESGRPLPRTWALLQRPFRELPTSFRLLRVGRLEGSSHGLSGPFSVRGVRSRTRGRDIPSSQRHPLPTFLTSSGVLSSARPVTIFR